MVLKNESAKMMYLIKRRAEASREELVANWFANHMPDVIAAQHAAAAAGRSHAARYIATLYNPPAGAEGRVQAWDGVAQLWWDEPTPQPNEPHGTTPRDTFQQKAEPYVPWATTEYVVLDGAVPFAPNDLNEPFPCTRSGFLKVTVLLAAKADANLDEFFTHWLGEHASNVRGTMEQVGGFRYVISLSNDPAGEPYVGMAELYFPDRDSLDRYQELFEPDGKDHWVDREAGHLFTSVTEMVGIP